MVAAAARVEACRATSIWSCGGSPSSTGSIRSIPATTSADDERGEASHRSLSQFALSDRLFRRTTKSAGGTARFSLLLARSRRANVTKQHGWHAAPAISRRLGGLSKIRAACGGRSWQRCSRRKRPTKLRARRPAGSRGVGWTAASRGNITSSPRGAQSRRSQRAVLRRPAADLLRPGGDPRRGALCRCHRAAIIMSIVPKAGSRPIIFDGLRRANRRKPVLVSEWFYAARENRTGNLNNGHLMTVDTQAERARGAAAAKHFAASRSSSGCTGFSTTTIRKAAAPTARIIISASSISRPALRAAGRGAGAANRILPAVHAVGPLARPRKEFASPLCRDRSDIARWTIGRSPRRYCRAEPSPGECRSARPMSPGTKTGWRSATIGQDYYDPGAARL